MAPQLIRRRSGSKDWCVHREDRERIVLMCSAQVWTAVAAMSQRPVVMDDRPAAFAILLIIFSCSPHRAEQRDRERNSV